MNDTPVLDIRVEGLRPHPENPRTITPERLEQLKRALVEDPQMLRARPLIALPDGRVIAGNQRLLAARELGWETIPCVMVDLDETRARTWMLRDNNGYGEWEPEGLSAMLSELQSDVDLELLGFNDGEIERLVGELPSPDGFVPPGGAGSYDSQFGVIVICEDEDAQKATFETLQGQGYNVRVVVT